MKNEKRETLHVHTYNYELLYVGKMDTYNIQTLMFCFFFCILYAAFFYNIKTE